MTLACWPFQIGAKFKTATLVEIPHMLQNKTARGREERISWLAFFLNVERNLALKVK